MSPCPACGSADVYLARTEEKAWHGHCAACSHDGPGRADSGEAGRAWDASRVENPIVSRVDSKGAA